MAYREDVLLPAGSVYAYRATRGGVMDIGRAVNAPFKDPLWKNKAALGGIWVALGVTMPAVVGAQIDYVRAVANGREDVPD